MSDIQQAPEEPKHVDDFIYDLGPRRTDGEKYAASWLIRFRRPAIDKMIDPDGRKLFATYEGVRYRVTGCSRLGDVWLSADFSRENGYEKRVNVETCSEWSAAPERPTDAKSEVKP